MSLTVSDKNKIITKLNDIHSGLANKDDVEERIPEDVMLSINSFHEKISSATSAFSNLITCLVANSVDNTIDPRYHRQPGGEDGMPEPETGRDNWFSGRSISEKVIYPWMSAAGYRTAKSGWQTRTFERPRPYTKDYRENIGIIKEPFLNILDAVAEGRVMSEDVISCFFLLEEQYKEKKLILKKSVSKNRIGNDVLITKILSAFVNHFKMPKSSRLPVLALYSIYTFIVEEISSYDGLKLLPLGAHEAADFRSGAIGDIELSDQEDDVIEALEVKHGIVIDYPILLKAEEKIKVSSAKRYYILTTHEPNAIPDKEIEALISKTYKEHGCQIIVNGVIPTLKYYLRLIKNPGQVLDKYAQLLMEDPSIHVEQLERWDEIMKEL